MPNVSEPCFLHRFVILYSKSWNQNGFFFLISDLFFSYLNDYEEVLKGWDPPHSIMFHTYLKYIS